MHERLAPLGLQAGVLFSLPLALVVGLPLGIVCFYWPRTGQAVLSEIGVIQTIPSLALLAFLISLFGLIGTTCDTRASI